MEILVLVIQFLVLIPPTSYSVTFFYLKDHYSQYSSYFRTLHVVMLFHTCTTVKLSKTLTTVSTVFDLNAFSFANDDNPYDFRKKLGCQT